jgi:hypothetical protein
VKDVLILTPWARSQRSGLFAAVFGYRGLAVYRDVVVREIDLDSGLRNHERFDLGEAEPQVSHFKFPIQI